MWVNKRNIYSITKELSESNWFRFKLGNINLLLTKVQRVLGTS